MAQLARLADSHIVPGDSKKCQTRVPGGHLNCAAGPLSDASVSLLLFHLG